MTKSKYAVIAVFVILCLNQAWSGGVADQLAEVAAATRGQRIGMITNPSGCDETGRLDADALMLEHGTSITAFFAPEHGLRGALPPGVGGGDYIDPETSIPVYAVYGTRNAPTSEQLAMVDALVCDLQDVGVRFYTFMWTMTYCMEAAAANGKSFFIIDRPNPIGGILVEGRPNTLNYGLIGRLGPGAAFCVATRHGMTAGEIATMWNTEWMIPQANLHVIKAPGWRRGQWWTETGRRFVPPSPNMRTPDTASVYPGTCIFEGSNISEGRGTTNPFELIGAPFINTQAYADRLTSLALPGVRFDPATFTPASSKWSGKTCGGARVTVTNRDVFEPVRAGMIMLQTAYQMYPSQVTITTYASDLMGVPNLHNRIKTEPVDSIVAEWQQLLVDFKAFRSRCLLYPDGGAVVGGWELF
ncbi:MAG: DUF1343 domain-containing protein [bacterium]|nr:DUF1343 domain-containing protein [Candidatus Sumerlaeota bacterium]